MDVISPVSWQLIRICIASSQDLVGWGSIVRDQEKGSLQKSYTLLQETIVDWVGHRESVPRQQDRQNKHAEQLSSSLTVPLIFFGDVS